MGVGELLVAPTAADVTVAVLAMAAWKRRKAATDGVSNLDIDGSEGGALSEVIDAYADALNAASEAAGRPATHCEGPACFEVDRCLCECACEGGVAALSLLVRAVREVRVVTRQELGAALADVERGIPIPLAVERSILARLRKRGAIRS